MTQTPENTTNLLTIRDLEVSFTTMHGKVQAVEGASMELPAGGTLAIVGSQDPVNPQPQWLLLVCYPVADK